ncbi:CWF19-like protein 2 isoform X1 [Vigna umbellata]|uniref:CWF19-like protein 2 isoform X1 n=1 Tax=Vigna umbellata TaxID=87088 RepID=UPI001F5EFFC7|nr:CWF19-like protein 2 isoform X1 [Vigna umbellata]
MFSGVKFIPRDQVDDEDLDSSSKERQKSDKRKGRNKKKGRSSRDNSDDDGLVKIKKGSRKKKWYSSDEDSSFYSSESESDKDEKKRRSKSKKKRDDSPSKMEIARKEMGLDWMLRAQSKKPAVAEAEENLSEEVPVDEPKKVNPKELNPYLKDSGSGYPEEKDGAKVGADQLLSSSLVGDGGASWRLKALKRSQEQAAREGRNFNEVVQERWGSLGELTASVASNAAAPARAHLRAIKNRQKGITEEKSPDSDKHGGRAPNKRDYLKDVSVRHHEMRKPKVEDSLSWGKRKSHQRMVAEGAGIISAAVSSLNKFSNDGSFMQNFDSRMSNNSDGSVLESVASRYAMQKISAAGQKKGEDDADMHLARKIMQNKKFSISTQADDEYDFEDGPSRKSRKKQAGDDGKIQKKTNRFLTQQERCLFCLENPNRPMHLVVSIANFTYLMLPQWQPVVPGHCCILPIQHESATRTVDDNVWTEIRNFKKCLIMMFAKQEKEVVFLETVMGLAQQRRHCMVECIPLPQDIAKEAPLYFKKAIDEAEDEWSQHNAKKLIDTSQKGLRNSIPKHFPYFHVEFGLNKGFVHVIDDEKQFNGSLGLNVLRGMLQLAEEDMYRRRRYEAVEVQKQLVASFSKEWDHFDWTKQLHETS